MKSGKHKTFSIIKKLRNDEGYTLIELLIAISILAVGLLAVATMQISAIRVNDTARKMTRRATMAQDRLEFLMSQSYTSVNSGSQVDGSYTISWTVSTGGSLPPSTKLIRMNVSQGGKTTSMSYIKPEL